MRVNTQPLHGQALLDFLDRADAFWNEGREQFWHELQRSNELTDPQTHTLNENQIVEITPCAD